MCLISVKSLKAQFFRILEGLYKCFIYNGISLHPQAGEMTFEQCVNRVVFSIPSPPKKRFEYFEQILPKFFREGGASYHSDSRWE